MKMEFGEFRIQFAFGKLKKYLQQIYNIIGGNIL